MHPDQRSGRPLVSGALAGAGSGIVFTALHHVLISDIWSTLAVMLAGGALCGLAVAWSYARLFRPPAASSWLLYNATYIVLLVLLGVVSIVLYDPIAPIPELLAAAEPLRELIREAMPLTIGFTLVSAVLLAAWRARGPLDFVAVLVACTAVLGLLGMNVSVLGLVELGGGGAFQVAQLLGLILALNAVYVGLFLLLERSTFRRATAGGAAASSTA
jgi:hypothetical protein